MTYLALSLYALGLIGAATAVSKDAPAGPREWAVCLVWPIAVALAIALAAVDTARGRA